MSAQPIEEPSYLTLARQAAASIDARNRAEQHHPASTKQGRCGSTLSRDRLSAFCAVLAEMGGAWQNATSAMVNLALPAELRFRSNVECNKLLNQADSMGLITQHMTNRGTGRDEITLTQAGYELAAQATPR